MRLRGRSGLFNAWNCRRLRRQFRFQRGEDHAPAPRDPYIAVQEEYEATRASDTARPIGFSSPDIRPQRLPQRRKRSGGDWRPPVRVAAWRPAYGKGSNNSVGVIAERRRGCFRLTLNGIS
jgi:hypothetical protein